MNGADETKGKIGPYIVGGVIVTPEIFQQGIESTGKNIEIGVRAGSELGSILATCAITGKVPYVAIKKRVVDGGEVVVGGEYGWEDDSQIVTERGVFDVFEGKLHSYLFANDVRQKMVDLLSELAQSINSR